VIAGIGVAIGTQAGALLIKADFTFVSLVGAVVFLISFLLVIVFLPSVQVATGTHGLLQGFRYVFRDRPFMRYVVLLMGYWFMSTQLSLTLALAASDIAGTESAVSWIYGINSLITVLLGYPLPRLMERRMEPFPTLILGIALTALGLGLVAAASNLVTLFACVTVMSLGTVIMRPGEQTITASLARPVARGSYFGVSALSLAIGGGLGNFAGGLIYDYGNDTGRPDLPWLVFAAVGAVSVIGLIRLSESLRARQTNQAEVFAEGV
jgi:DHA1 family multidrug resistance protein-like MFS transporter